MYSRDYAGRTLNFEPSGGLIQGSLVMQDKETDSYWSIMTGKAEGGVQSGTRLEELPLGVKVQWKEWVRRHPDTVVLSLDGVEDLRRNVYADYYASDSGFGPFAATDSRLQTKDPIYSFREGERPVAIPFSEYEGGAAFESGGKTLFLYRPKGARLFHSTAAYSTESGGFEQVDGHWVHKPSGLQFDPATETFGGDGNEDLRRMSGFDTFWYNWSLIHPDSEVLRRKR